MLAFTMPVQVSTSVFLQQFVFLQYARAIGRLGMRLVHVDYRAKLSKLLMVMLKRDAM